MDGEEAENKEGYAREQAMRYALLARYAIALRAAPEAIALSFFFCAIA